MDRVQLVRAATRALNEFEEGEKRRNELISKKETFVHEIRAQARIFRKHCREYLVHLWLALNKNSSWYTSWEEEFRIKLEIPCTEVEAKISVLYDQVEQAKLLNQEKLQILSEEAETSRSEWHMAEKDIHNFWWYKFAEGNCVWFAKWQQWHNGIRLEKKVYEDRRKEEAKVAEAHDAIVEEQQERVAAFNPGDIVDAKCKGWHTWWVGEVRRVEDPQPGSGKFFYYLKFQDGERIRGVEERRLRPPTNTPPATGMFNLIEESIAATSDYTNDSLGNPGSEESDYYFETDSDIPPPEPETAEEVLIEQQKSTAKEERKKHREAKKRKNKAKKNKDKEIQRSDGGTVLRSDDGDGTGDDEMSSDESGNETDSSEEEEDPLQLILDRAIEFCVQFPNAGPREIPWEKIFTENGYQYQEWEAERLQLRYNFRKMCYYPVEKVEKKLDEEGEEIKSVGSVPSTDGYSPLLIAAFKGNFNKVRIIVDGGADINMVAEDGETPLIAAARNGHEGVVRLAVEMGALVNKVKSSTGESAALAARRAGHENVVVLLYELGATHVPREKQDIRWFGHRKIAGMVISETESERSSDRHSWDLDEDHPLEFEDIFKPVSVRRKEKKDARRKEKIAARMHETPLTEIERKDLIFSSTRRTALQQWDTLESVINAASVDTKEIESALRPPFKNDKWDRHTKIMTQDPIKLLPKKQREKLLVALRFVHHLRLAVEWRDHSASCKLATLLLEAFKSAGVPMNKAGGIMQFSGGPWDTLEPIELSTLSQIASAVPTAKELIEKLQIRYDTDVLEHASESLINIGNIVNPGNVNINDVQRLAKIFDRLAVLPKARVVKKTREELKTEALAAEAAAFRADKKEEKTEERKRPMNRAQIEAEAAAKLAAASREEKVLGNPKMIVKAIVEFTKRPTTISSNTVRYLVRYRYEATEGQLTWEQFVDCATSKIPSRFEIRRMYHVGRVMKTSKNMRERFMKWARSIKHKLFLNYGQNLPMFRYILEKEAATKIQNWFRCLQEYYGFLKQKYVFDMCKHVQEAAMTIQSFFWRKYGVVAQKERVVRDFVMVYDKESDGTFYVDKTVMAGRMYLPARVRGCLREYTNSTRFTNPVTIRALRPWQLNEKAESLNYQNKIKGIAAQVHTHLEKRKGKFFMYMELHDKIIDIDEQAEQNVIDSTIELLVFNGILEYQEATGRYKASVEYHAAIV